MSGPEAEARGRSAPRRAEDGDRRAEPATSRAPSAAAAGDLAPSGGEGRAAGAGLSARASTALTGRRARLRGTVYLLLDTSASMADDGKMSQLVRGAVRFFYEAWRRRYAVGVIAFATRAEVRTGATRDPSRLQRAVFGLRPDGRTAMDRAIRLAAWRLRFRRGHRVALLITDGMPDDRRAALDAAAAARAAGVTVIAVGTDVADEAFLRALVPKPTLAERVEVGDLAEGIERAAGALDRG